MEAPPGKRDDRGEGEKRGEESRGEEKRGKDRREVERGEEGTGEGECWREWTWEEQTERAQWRALVAEGIAEKVPGEDEQGGWVHHLPATGRPMGSLLLQSFSPVGYPSVHSYTPLLSFE